MAAVTAATVTTVATSAYSANQQKKAAKDGMRASQQATDATIAEQRRQFDITNADQRPFIEAGQDALKRQNAFLNGDFSGFNQSPDYAYARDQMQQGLDRSAAARGRLYSGGYGVDMAAQLNGLANQNANNYWNRLAGQANQGQTTGNQLGAFGASMAGNIGNAFGNNAANRASAYGNIANANSGLAGTIGGAFTSIFNNRKPGVETQPAYTGSGTQFGNNFGPGGFGGRG